MDYSPPGSSVHGVLQARILEWVAIRLSLFLFILFSIFCSAAVISTILSSRSFICSSASVILLLISSHVLFTSVYLFFSTSRSLVIISCIFSIFASILFLRSWTIFTIIILNSFSGRLLISTSFHCFSRVLSCLFTWDTTFCFFNVINFL